MAGHCRCRGFSLIELSAVFIISGLLTVAALSVYNTYYKAEAVRTAYKKLKTIDLNLEAFFEKHGRYPCPAAPALPDNDPLAGKENCLAFTALGLGACSSTGLCRARGRATPYDGAGADPVAIGAVPYVTIREFATAGQTIGSVRSAGGGLPDNISRDTTVDIWGRQMTYAISEQMMAVRSFEGNPGVIRLKTEAEEVLADNAIWVVMAHGKNGICGYTERGVYFPPPSSGPFPKDYANCNLQIQPADVTFVNGIMALAAGPNYFDDLVYASTGGIKGLWVAADSAPGDITTRNPGKVGIALPMSSLPTAKLHVGGDIKAADTQTASLCNPSGNRCFDPAKLGGSGMLCPPPSGPVSYVMSGISDGNVNNFGSPCHPVGPPPVVLPLTCPGFDILTGVTSNGCIICGSSFTVKCS